MFERKKQPTNTLKPTPTRYASKHVTIKNVTSYQVRLLPSDSPATREQKTAELTFLLNLHWGEDTNKPELEYTFDKNGAEVISFPASTSITGMNYNPLVYDDIEFIPSTIVTE